MHEADALIGLWHILHWQNIYDDGRTIAPFGNNLRGFLRYAPDGQMMCIIAKPARALFISDQQFEASLAEKAQAYDDFFVYAGRYERQDTMVVHHVDYALFPNWQNSTQHRRIAHLSADHLSLEADKRNDAVAPHIVQITWQRAV